MRIADGIPLGIVAIFIAWVMTGFISGALSPLTLAPVLACAAGMFGAGTLAFTAGAVGGGDVKLASAAALFAGPALILDFMAVTAVVGGLLGLAILAGAPIGSVASAGDGSAMRPRRRTTLPYGPAIAAGGLWVAMALAMA